MRPGPITTTCFHHEVAETPCSIEIVDLETGELIDRNPVSWRVNELLAFEAEVARCEHLRDRDADFEPIVVRLMDSDLELDRKEISRECRKVTA